MSPDPDEFRHTKLDSFVIKDRIKQHIKEIDIAYPCYLSGNKMVEIGFVLLDINKEIRCLQRTKV